MKHVLAFILIWSFLVVTGSILAANSQTLSRTQVNSADYSETIGRTTEAK